MKNRKKIRGWNRQIKQLNRFASERLFPNVQEYEIYGRTYCRFFIDPWYRLIKRNPPVWFFKLMIAHLSNAFSEWEAFFSNRNQPFDLQIWLFSKTFIKSEIYCAKVDENGEERHLFEVAKVQRQFPKLILGAEIEEKLAWTLFDDLEYLEESDLLEIYGTLDAISKKNYIQQVRPDGSKYYTLKIGEVWVGRSKPKQGKAF